MNAPSPLQAPQSDPQDFIRDLENDPLTQLVWSILPAVSVSANKVVDLLKSTLSQPSMETQSTQLNQKKLSN
jgi:hypothetical protein